MYKNYKYATIFIEFSYLTRLPNKSQKVKPKTVNFLFHRVTEYSQNYVDRVRFTHLSEENKKHSGSEYHNYKQKSASNLDLSISRKNTGEHLINNKIRPSKSLDCNTQNNYTSDLSWKSKENYEELNSIGYGKLYNLYNSWVINFKISANEIINFFNNKIYPSDEFCSLRRSRSLAIIREENKNLFQTANENNQAQLIPRAKLLSKAIINER